MRPIAVLCLAAIACRGEAPPPAAPAPAPPPATESQVVHRVDGERMLDLVRLLSSPEFAGRSVGTPGGKRARAVIAEHLREAGLEPIDEDYLLPFRFTHHSIRGLFEKDRRFRERFDDAANVAGKLSGTDPSARVIVVSAHYDHLGVRDGRLFPGADDNASGVAALLEAARWFATHRPRHPMVFVAFDAEEMDLVGAKAFVAHPPVPRERIALDVNFDMLARNDHNEIYAAGPTRHPFLVPILEEVRRHAAVKVAFGHDQPGSGHDDWTEQSDQGAFADAGIPFLYFGVEDHADYHRPSDTADKIDPVFFTAVGDMVLDTLVRLDAALPERPAG